MAIDGLMEKTSTDPAHVPGDFSERIAVTMSSSIEDGQIHYTINGQPPSLSSPIYESPLLFRDTVTVKARFFDGDGRPKGETLERVLVRVEP